MAMYDRWFEPLRVAASVLMLACAWWIIHSIRHPTLTYFDDRLPGTLHQAELVPKGGTLVIGDSTAGANYFPTLCGRPAMNAGIGWATSHDWAPHVAEIVSITR